MPGLDSKQSTLDGASVVLAMICEAMRALTAGLSADEVVCRHLNDALPGGVTAVAAIIADTGELRVVQVLPKDPVSLGLATTVLPYCMRPADDRVTVQWLESHGHLASARIRPALGDAAAASEGRLLIVLRNQPIDPGGRALLERAWDTLTALWPHAVRSVRAQRAQDWVRATAAEGGVTPRELQVLDLLAQGLLATSIASRLRLSPRTVHKHLGNIYRKLGVHDRLVAVSLARVQGLIDYPSSPTTPATP